MLVKGATGHSQKSPGPARINSILRGGLRKARLKPKQRQCAACNVMDDETHFIIKCSKRYLPHGNQWQEYVKMVYKILIQIFWGTKLNDLQFIVIMCHYFTIHVLSVAHLSLPMSACLRDGLCMYMCGHVPIYALLVAEYAYIDILTHMYLCVCMYVCMYVWVCAYESACAYAHVYMLIFIYIIYTHYICIHIIYIYIYVCVYIWMCIYFDSHFCVRIYLYAIS